MGPRLFFYLFFATLVLTTHAPFWNLPYYWDELGQFIPAALDLFHSGALIPYSTVPNVHPPGLMVYLAAVWSIAGYSIEATRVAMLALASAGVLAAFLLAIDMSRELRGTPAFVLVVLLCASPVFYEQAMLAQLDMPAMVFTCLALLLFFRNRIRWAAAACIALAMVKETGLIVPAVLGVWLWREHRRRQAMWFVLPAIPMVLWIGLLAWKSGNPFGNSEFAQFNLLYPLHPVRLGVALGRRLYFLFFQDFHWIGTVAIVAGLKSGRQAKACATGDCGTEVPSTARQWRIAWTLIGAHILVLSVCGGAVLERYLLPVLPLVYIAMIEATSRYSRRIRMAAQALLLAGLVAGNFWNPPYPFPYENNLALTDFVALQRTAAEFLSRARIRGDVVTAWPFSAALTRPEYGYVDRPIPVRPLGDFRPATIDRINWDGVTVFVLYSRTWNPQWNWFHFGPFARVAARFYDFTQDITPLELRARYPMRRVAEWSRRGQWIVIYAAI